MLSFTPESADFWYKLAGASAVILAALTTTAGVVSYVAGNARDRFSDLRLSNTELATAEANKSAAHANQRTEELRAKNLELEKAIAPRSLEQARSSTALRAFAGTDVYIASVPEFEARRFSAYLRVMFEMAGWHIHELPLSEDLGDGVEVAYSAGIKTDPIDPAKTIFNFNEKGEAAAKELIAQLEANNIEVRRRWIPFRMLAQVRDAAIPSEALVVRVGLKPNTYFTNQMIEEFKSKGSVISNNR
jgi:hypothetical protein